MFCRNCGNELKEGVRFCPKCGVPIEQPPKEEPAPTVSNQEHRSTANDAFRGIGRAKEKQSTQTGTVAEAKPKNAHNKGLIKFVAIAGAFTMIMVLLGILGSSRTSYADGVVKANNEFGLSTTLTLEEFVERYNEALVSLDLNHDIYWLHLDDGQLLDSTPGITEYQLKFSDYKFPKSEMSKLQQHMNVGVDNETGYVVSVVFKYSASAYMSPSITDTETDVVGKRGFAVPIALFGGNAEKQLSRAAELMNSPQGFAWEKGILYIGAGDVGDGFVNVGFQTMTQEVYNEKYGQ